MTEAEQAAAIHNHFAEWARNDSEYKMVSKRVPRYAHVVPVVLDLAKVLIIQAQESPDESLRGEYIDQAVALLAVIERTGSGYAAYERIVVTIQDMQMLAAQEIALSLK